MIFALIDDRSTGATNGALVDHLKESGSISSARIESAFRAVDRAKFMPKSVPAGGTSPVVDASVYDDAPVRSGHFHISQPSLYAQAMELLDLQPGLSFLNIGGGTGYLSSLVSEILGGSALHHGVDIHQDVLKHAAAMFREQGKDYIEFFNVNAHDLDLDLSPRYDRIYAGACVGAESKRLLELLAVGGILVGPFESASGQFIRKVVRQSGTTFEVKNLKSVQFGQLVPTDSPPAQPFVLPSPVWTPSTHGTHSLGFRNAVLEVLFSTTRKESPTHIPPREVFVNHIFGFLHPRWFDDQSEKEAARREIFEHGEERDTDDEGGVDDDLMRLRTLSALAAVLSRQGAGEPTLERFRRLLERHAAADAAVESSNGYINDTTRRELEEDEDAADETRDSDAGIELLHPQPRSVQALVDSTPSAVNA